MVIDVNHPLCVINSDNEAERFYSSKDIVPDYSSTIGNVIRYRQGDDTYYLPLNHASASRHVIAYCNSAGVFLSTTGYSATLKISISYISGTFPSYQGRVTVSYTFSSNYTKQDSQVVTNTLSDILETDVTFTVDGTARTFSFTSDFTADSTTSNYAFSHRSTSGSYLQSITLHLKCGAIDKLITAGVGSLTIELLD